MLRPLGLCVHLKFVLTTFCVVLIHVVITPFNVVILNSSTAKDCPVLQQTSILVGIDASRISKTSLLPPCSLQPSSFVAPASFCLDLPLTTYLSVVLCIMIGGHLSFKSCVSEVMAVWSSELATNHWVVVDLFV